MALKIAFHGEELIPLTTDWIFRYLWRNLSVFLWHEDSNGPNLKNVYHFITVILKIKFIKFSLLGKRNASPPSTLAAKRVKDIDTDAPGTSNILQLHTFPRNTSHYKVKKHSFFPFSNYILCRGTRHSIRCATV